LYVLAFFWCILYHRVTFREHKISTEFVNYMYVQAAKFAKGSNPPG
jgi:hypothetical protein